MQKLDEVFVAPFLRHMGFYLSCRQAENGVYDILCSKHNGTT
jgi:hypothetical protein